MSAGEGARGGTGGREVSENAEDRKRGGEANEP